MGNLDIAAELARRNLAVGEWTSPKGEKHVSITRMGRYNKNIAIPVSLINVLVEAMHEKVDELNGL